MRVLFSEGTNRSTGAYRDRDHLVWVSQEVAEASGESLDRQPPFWPRRMGIPLGPATDEVGGATGHPRPIKSSSEGGGSRRSVCNAAQYLADRVPCAN